MLIPLHNVLDLHHHPGGLLIAVLQQHNSVVLLVVQYVQKKICVALENHRMHTKLQVDLEYVCCIFVVVLCAHVAFCVLSFCFLCALILSICLQS